MDKMQTNIRNERSFAKGMVAYHRRMAPLIECNRRKEQLTMKEYVDDLRDYRKLVYETGVYAIVPEYPVQYAKTKEEKDQVHAYNGKISSIMKDLNSYKFSPE